MLSTVRLPKTPYAPPVCVCGKSKLPPPVFDGRLDKPFWEQAKPLTVFHDIEGDTLPSPKKQTSVRILWDDDALYIGARLDDDTIWANITERDSVIFFDNDFEVFLDPVGSSHRYYELEMNAANAVWDLLMEKPQRDGVHRIISWDIAGLETAVHIEGELNNPNADNKYWSAEIKIPWFSLRESDEGQVLPSKLAPIIGETWRLNFSRVEYEVETRGGRYEKLTGADGKPMPEHNWVWSPTGVIDIHMPEMWGFLQFAESADARFVPDPDEDVKNILYRLYYKERNYGAATGAYTADETLLNIKTNAKIYVTPNMFEIILQDWHIRQDGYLWRE